MASNNKSYNLTYKGNEFKGKLLEFSKSISFDWLLNQDIAQLNNTSAFDTLIRLFPPLEETFQKGLTKDPQEFFKTLPHIFQAQAAYNRIYSGDFPESQLDRDAIKAVHDLAHCLASFSPFVMPAILWLHDIGRFEDKRRHNEKSAEMILEFNLLKDRGLTMEEAILIRKVVQYHLLIGTLYTGESSYMSFESLLFDEEFQIIMNDSTSIKRFLDSLTLFTMIDVWGYHINDISPTMIGNYLEIKKEMGEIFTNKGDIKKVAKGLKEKSRKHLDWRLMGYMMAFSKIGKKPHLTLDFYAGMIDDGFKRYIEREGLSIDWDRFKDKYLDKFDQVQFKYGLGVLIPLTYGGTGKKMHLKEDTKVNPNLFHLLANINSRIKKEEETNPQSIPGALWNVIFKGYPLWNQLTDFQERLNEPGLIEEIVNKGSVNVDDEEKVNVLSIDYTGFWEHVEY